MKNTILGFLLASMFGFLMAAGEEAGALFEQPVLITSAGQSADVRIAAVLAKRAGLDAVLSKLATGTQLKGQKTLILTVGVSLKGLGAAGLDIEQERERIRLLIKEAEAEKIPVLCLHLGGEARRGTSTDLFIHEFVPLAARVIVVASGNGDGLFTRICKENNIPLVEVDKTASVLERLKNMF
jgi:hypothetical protein